MTDERSRIYDVCHCFDRRYGDPHRSSQGIRRRRWATGIGNRNGNFDLHTWRAMPDGEFEELLSDIWTPVVSDIRHFLDVIQRERHPGNRSARPGSAAQEQNRQGQPDR